VYSAFRPLLFQIEPENVHNLTIQLLRTAGRITVLNRLVKNFFNTPKKTVHAFGLDFPNPVGLAAGYDKDGLAWRGLASLGFGHIEVGTVTLKSQLGNPRPRVFRLPEDQALINRMGFPGRGVDFVARRLSRKPQSDLVLGVNIGKNRDTPLEKAGNEYAALFKTLSPLADYIAINVSSPNTVGLRRLQARTALEALLQEINNQRQESEIAQGSVIPVLVKLSPDLTIKELEDALDVILANNIDGVIATNTTLDRNSLNSTHASQQGGLSGLPLFSKSLDMVKQVVQLTNGSLPVIGVGGIMKPEHALKMLEAGAVLVQIYTGLVYSGPRLVSDIVRQLPG